MAGRLADGVAEAVLDAVLDEERQRTRHADEGKDAQQKVPQGPRPAKVERGTALEARRRQ